eukprot:351961-Chlamydomonas_euryale.AAC.3
MPALRHAGLRDPMQVVIYTDEPSAYAMPVIQKLDKHQVRAGGQAWGHPGCGGMLGCRCGSMLGDMFCVLVVRFWMGDQVRVFACQGDADG